MTSETIQAHDNGSFSCFVAKPDQLPAPGIVLIQEIFGVNHVMRELAEEYASQGYIVFCPDLFWRIEPGVDITDKTEEEWQKAFDLFGKFDVDTGVEDLKSTAQALRNHTDCNGHVGSVGYCLGGKLAFLMACRSDADCNVSYYGVGLDEYTDEGRQITTPLLMHMAEKDQFFPPEARGKVVAALEQKPNIEMHVYEGMDHAFARVGGDHYDKQAADLANERTRQFFEKNLKMKKAA